MGKDFCMSSFLALRYIEKADEDFSPTLRHRPCKRLPDSLKTPIGGAHDLDCALDRAFSAMKGERLGLLLSGGMDSAILASYMPEGADAYTFRFLGGSFQADELARAQTFARRNRLNLHYVDIDWSVVERCLEPVMASKGAPVHSIEPQLYFAALQARADGVEKLVIGDAADYVFGGMDGLYAQDWSYDAFVRRYTYIEPSEVLVHPVSMDYLFERYRTGPGSIDFVRFLDHVCMDESYASYENAFAAASMPYTDPYEPMKMSEPLDLKRMRSGDSKYIVRALFRLRYPDIPVPEKLPMPRPVDQYFARWTGPRRPEFRPDIDISRYSGNQRWLLWCLEQFLNRYFPL
ncbi:MAG: hypothetical protein J5669_08650 [Bacteroidales bacterium]|nr:hypothetical protein [Bacteroidales bacterium]